MQGWGLPEAQELPPSPSSQWQRHQKHNAYYLAARGVGETPGEVPGLQRGKYWPKSMGTSVVQDLLGQMLYVAPRGGGGVGARGGSQASGTELQGAGHLTQAHAQVPGHCRCPPPRPARSSCSSRTHWLQSQPQGVPSTRTPQGCRQPLSCSRGQRPVFPGLCATSHPSSPDLPRPLPTGTFPSRNLGPRPNISAVTGRARTLHLCHTTFNSRVCGVCSAVREPKGLPRSSLCNWHNSAENSWRSMKPACSPLQKAEQPFCHSRHSSSTRNYLNNRCIFLKFSRVGGQ